MFEAYESIEQDAIIDYGHSRALWLLASDWFCIAQRKYCISSYIQIRNADPKFKWI